MPAARQLHPAVLAVAGVVAAAAFAFSADSWVQLAEIAGFHTHWTLGTRRVYLSWLLPIAFDAYTALATWAYFTARGLGFREYAKYNALGSAALSIVVQGAYHGLKANDVDVASKWGLVVAVGAIPAALLAAVVHLIAEYLRDRRVDTAAARVTESSVHEPAPLPMLAQPVDLRAPQSAAAPPAPAGVAMLARPVDLRAPRATAPLPDSAPRHIPTIVIPAPLARATDTPPVARHEPAPPRHNGAPPERANGRATTVLARPASPPAPRATRAKPARATSAVEQRRAAIRAYLRANPGAGSRAISAATGIPDRTVTRDLQAIKEES